jgi:hypothetical protein
MYVLSVFRVCVYACFVEKICKMWTTLLRLASRNRFVCYVCVCVYVLSVFRVCVYACVVFKDMQDVDDSAETCFKEQVCVLHVYIYIYIYMY